ncbi:MAG: MutH/Sau3AI family endonuclease [Myxococcota bacterium]|nr:MutH/Sau3AI family endonuclease [Myxococcota bacterium]
MSVSREQLNLFSEYQPPTLEEARLLLDPLLGQDLRPYGEHFGFFVKDETQATDMLRPKTKGWAGLTVERLLGRGADNSQEPDFGDWELKVIPLLLNAAQELVVKSEMAITMLQPAQLTKVAFEESHLWHKLRRLLVVARLYESAHEPRSLVCAIAAIDLLRDEPSLVPALRADYESLCWGYQRGGVAALDEVKGRYLELRPKGTKRSGGVAFYAKRKLVERLLVHADTP